MAASHNVRSTQPGNYFTYILKIFASGCHNQIIWMDLEEFVCELLVYERNGLRRKSIVSRINLTIMDASNAFVRKILLLQAIPPV